ncbi:squalene/phytoene synthase family protein [Sandarakinorhabdus sp.]|jgi:phytoene synthase|uniref:squalene/phytoene synthase family protein n=1 Tax=Sandarakinorhabdus sp. TaxID=1916663 RepID=UPI003562F734
MDPFAIIARELKQRDRERWLACLYAAAPARPALVALLALDSELAHVVASSTDPMLGEIKLAWWRDRLIELDTGPAPAQPLLQALQARVLPRLSGADLATLEDRWLCLLGAEDLPSAHVEGGAALFVLAARLLGGDLAEAAMLGRAWMLGRWGEGQGVPGRTSILLRPLRVLAELAARDAAHHAAGRPLEPRGNAARQWLMLKVVAFGR